MDLTIIWENDESYNTVNSCNVLINPHHENSLNLKVEWRHNQGWSGEIINQSEDEDVIVKWEKTKDQNVVLLENLQLLNNSANKGCHVKWKHDTAWKGQVVTA